MDVQTAACGALTRLAAMSPEAAARMFELDVLGDIRRMLPKPDRLSTPPDTPESLDVDNVFRELFHDDGDDGDGDGDAGDDRRALRRVRSILHWSPYDRVRVVNADP